jgi:steroid 5-alpha reductase family enzyme
MLDSSSAAPTTRTRSFTLVGVAYLVALVAGLAVLYLLPATAPVWRLLAADVVATVAVFACSMAVRNSSLYDPYWSVAPPFFVLFWAANAAPGSVALRQVVVAMLVFAWGARLTMNWARGWQGLSHQDWRYENLYTQSPLPNWGTSLLGIHLFPTIQVFLGALALIPAVATGSHAVGALDLVAGVVTAGAIVIETVADEQLHAFNRTKAAGDILATGLWKYSRHPNYFGELGFWCGLWLFGVAAAPGAWWWTLLGPVAMTLMFVFASIPMLDQRSIERRAGYAEHMRRVSAVVPWFPRT